MNSGTAGAGAAGAGFGAGLGPGVGRGPDAAGVTGAAAGRSETTGFGAGGRGGSRTGGLRGRGGCRPRRGSLACGGLAATVALLEGVGQLAYYGRLDRRRRRTDEFTELLELGHDDLALNPELLGEFVYPDLSHFAPFRSGLRPDRRYFMGVLIACSSSAHRNLDLLPTRGVPGPYGGSARHVLRCCLLDAEAQRRCVEHSLGTQRPWERPAAYRQVQTDRGGVNVRTPAGQRTAMIGDAFTLDRHDPQQISLGRSLPAPHTGAFRACAGSRPARHS